MSRSSGCSAGKKSRHGTQTERQRVRTFHIMETQTAKLAALVAKNVKEQIAEAVKDELDRRGYRDQQDSGPPGSVPEKSSEQADPETPKPMEEKKHCPKCQEKLSDHSEYFSEEESDKNQWFCETCGYVV